MTDALTESEYEEEIKDFSRTLVNISEELVEAGDFDTKHDAVLEMVNEELNHHEWFARNYYDGALYGSVVEHADADVGRYSDWQALIETNEPLETLKRLAYVVMEADALERAQRRLDDE